MRRALTCVIVFSICLAALALAVMPLAAETLPAASVPGADTAAQLLAMLPESLDGWITLAIGACAVLASVLPRPGENSTLYWRILYAVINAVGFNVWRARNLKDAKSAK